MSKINEIKNLNSTVSERIQSRPNYTENNLSKGLLGENIIEPANTIQLDTVPSEKVITGKSNAWIVMGRDRPSTFASGYGGRGATNAASIDIVAGRASSANVDSIGDAVVSPNFINDAARIYISQKCDIDQYFGLAQGDVKSTFIKARSGIGIKADTVRIVGREGIRIVTGKAKDASGSGKYGEKNSLGGDIASVAGIELIAGNNTDEEKGFDFSRGFYTIKNLQPIPKGENLADSLEKLTDYINTLAGNLRLFMIAQTKYNRSLATHIHISPFLGIPTPPSPTLPVAMPIANTKIALYKKSTKTVQNSLKMLSLNYFDSDGKFWICSRYNKTN